MPGTFRRGCESALTQPATVVARAALITAVLVNIIACEYQTDYGTTRVAATADSVIVETVVGGPADDIRHYESENRGLTWQFLGYGYGYPTPNWNRDWVDTPKGRYRIDGSNIARVSDNNRVLETVYSAEHFDDHRNRWVQAKETERLGRRDLSFEPFGIAYDEQSGNLVLQRRMLNLVRFGVKIASPKPRPQGCPPCGLIAIICCPRSLSCEPTL